MFLAQAKPLEHSKQARPSPHLEEGSGLLGEKLEKQGHHGRGCPAGADRQQKWEQEGTKDRCWNPGPAPGWRGAADGKRARNKRYRRGPGTPMRCV